MLPNTTHPHALFCLKQNEPTIDIFFFQDDRHFNIAIALVLIHLKCDVFWYIYIYIYIYIYKLLPVDQRGSIICDLVNTRLARFLTSPQLIIGLSNSCMLSHKLHV